MIYFYGVKCKQLHISSSWWPPLKQREYLKCWTTVFTYAICAHDTVGSLTNRLTTVRVPGSPQTV